MAQYTTDEMRVALLEALEAQADEHGIDIVDVEVVGSAKAPIVRVRIDHANEDEGLISLDEVSSQTGWISDLVDEMDPIEGRYMLEVSSPGLSRPLRRQRDFERFAGSTVSLTLKTTEGRRRYTGKLEGFVDGKVALVTDEGPFACTIDEIRTCTIKPDFDNTQKKGGKGGRRGGKR